MQIGTQQQHRDAAEVRENRDYNRSYYQIEDHHCAGQCRSCVTADSINYDIPETENTSMSRSKRRTFHQQDCLKIGGKPNIRLLARFCRHC